MGLIPQTKCSRCDRTYSGLRSRCPYCGARRSKRGKRVSDGSNATWKLIIGVLLIVVLIAAVVVILVTGRDDKGPDDGSKGSDKSSDASVDSQQGQHPNDPPDDPTTTNVSVKDAEGNTVTSLNLHLDEIAELTAVVTPDTVTTVPVWTCSDESAVKLEVVDETGLTCHVTGIANNTSATVTVTVDEAKYEFTVTCSDGGTSNPPAIATDITVKTMWGNLADDITVDVGESCDLYATITPSNVSSVPTWTNSNSSVVELVAVDETGLRYRVTGMAGGVTTVTVTVDGVKFDCIIYCSGRPES